MMETIKNRRRHRRSAGLAGVHRRGAQARGHLHPVLGKRLQASLFRRLRDEDGNFTGSHVTGPDLLFSRKWEAGGPIIVQMCKDGFSLDEKPEYLPHAQFNYNQMTGTYRFYASGPTLLIAAMRCYVASKLGDTVEVPEELA